MSNVSNIQFTTNYKQFQLFPSNRKIMQSHVDSMVNDSSFAKKIHTCPIVVNKELYIIDGQHRLKAAEKLGIPIYYIIDENAGESDICTRNTQMKAWVSKDYIDHFASIGNRNYIIVKKIMESHKITATFLNPILQVLCGYKRFELYYHYKQGKLKIEKFEKELNDFFNMVVPGIKYARTVKGQLPTRPLFTEVYIFAYAHYFKKDVKTLARFLRKLPTCGLPFPFCANVDEAKGIIAKVAKWCAPKEDLDMEAI